MMVVAAQSNILTIDDVNKTLEDSLKTVFESERFKDLLDVMSRVKAYSLNNQILIVAQNPQSTMVMGFNEWQKLGRFVQKGEKGLKILAPVVNQMDKEKIDPQTKQPMKDSQGNIQTEKRNVIRGFRPVTVFDVSQTEGKEIPSVRDFISRQMADDSYISQLYSDYKDYLVDNKGINVSEQETEKGVGGWYRRDTGEIAISTNTNENNTDKFRVLIHEYAHSLLHNDESDMKDLPRGHKEAQAESVAYVVSNYYGLDSSAVSSGYIATWSQDMQLARQALTEIQEVANTIIEQVDALQKDKIQSFYKDQTQDYEDVKKHLIEKVGLSEKAFDQNEKTPTQIQMINKENGYILSGKLEYSERTQMFYMRTNRNLIEPVSELAKDGKLAMLNIEKELGKVNNITEYSRIPDHFEVKKIRNGPYVVQSASGQDIISKGFEKKGDAQEFQMRASISQTLHQDTFFKKELKTKDLQSEMNEVTTEVERQINQSVGQYLSHHSKKPLNLQGTSGITIGWTLLKNPQIKTIDDLKEFASKNKHVPTYTKLPEALENLQETTQTEEKTSVKKRAKDNAELERSMDR